jgi:APA family basic amino acid/polyamine antiporter
LRREVGLAGAVGLGLGSILGTGVFVSLGIAAGVVGPGLVLAILLAAVVATANGLSSAQLAAAHPVSGGTYEYAYRYLHPKAGIVAGWLFLVAKSASAATAALGFAAYLLHLLSLPFRATTVVALALGLVGLMTLLVAGGIRRSNAANGIVVAITLASLGTFVVAAWQQSGTVALLSAADPSALWGPGEYTAVDLLRATALLFVAYTGYGRIATLGEEVRRPAWTIPRAILITLGLSLLLYSAVAAAALATVGVDAFAAATRGDAAPLEAVARTFASSRIAQIVSLGAVTAMAGVLLNLILGSSRVILAMARRRDLPVFLDRIHPRTATPHRAVWSVSLVIALLVLIGDVRTTWAFSAFTVLIYYGLTNLAALRLPPKDRRFPRWIAVLGLLGCLMLAPLAIWP